MATRWILSARERWVHFSERPFVLLVRLFVGRMFHGVGDSGESEVGIGTGLVLTLLPLPGGFYAVFLFEKYSTLLQWMRGEHLSDPAWAALPEEYFFIVLSMVVTGSIAVWRWDAIFPDRRDYANLASLPLAATAVLLANVCAIAFFAFVLAVDLNAASGLLFPLAVGASVESFTFFVHFLAIHLATVLVSSLFSFLCVFFLVGILMVLLPYSAFRRISRYARSLILAGLLTLLVTSSEVPRASGQWLSVIKFLPSYWFLGLSRRWQGDHSALARLGHTGLLVFAFLVLACLLVYLISYRKCFLRISETLETNSELDDATNWGRVFGLLDRTLLLTSFQQAAYRFVMKTLFRSETHSLILGAFAGLGVVTASQFLLSRPAGTPLSTTAVPGPEIFSVPLVLAYCLIVGVRFAFAVPAEIQGNWIFKFLLDRDRHESAQTAFKVMLSFVLPWIFVIVLPAYSYLWSWRVGLLTTLVTACWAVLLAQILLLRFRTLPFTSSYPAFRDSAVVLAISYILGFFAFVPLTAQLEYWASSSVVPRIFLGLIAAVTWYILSSLRRSTPDIDRALQFDQAPDRSFEVLNIGSAD